MMPDLGKYAFAVLGSYAAGLASACDPCDMDGDAQHSRTQTFGTD